MKKITIALTLAVITATSIFIWMRSDKNETKSCRTSYHEKEEYFEKGEFEGYKNFFDKIRGSADDGSFTYADYYKAREDAKSFAAAGSRGALNIEWEEMGPDNQGGRARALLIDRNNPNRIFCGGVSGGIWVSNNKGASWSPVAGSEDYSNLTVSCIAQAGNGNIYFGTGEYFGFFEASNVNGATGFPGGGIWCSTNNGESFSNILDPEYPANGPTSGSNFAFITAMRADPTDPNRVYFATNVTGTAYKGIRIINASTNAITNAGGSIVGTGQDVEVASDGTVHAIVNKKYFRSAAGGQSFVAVPSSSGLPQSGLSRLDIAVSPQDPNYVYALATNSTNAGDILRGIYKSTDGGTTFTTICGPSLANSPDWMPVTQGFYCIDLAVHPLDKDVLIFGGLDVYRYTTQSGAKKISNWNYSAISSQYVHADIHRFDFDPTNPDNMYVLSDGGVNWTSNILASEVNWVTKNKNFITTQCYSVCAKNYTGEILTGMQDNGNYFIDFTGNTSKFGRLIKGGDGGDVAVSTINPNILFAEYVNGSVERSSNNGNSFANFFDCNIDFAPAASSGGCGGNGEPDDGAPFIAQFELWENIYETNPLKRSKFFIGTNKALWLTQEPLNLLEIPTWFKVSKTSSSGGVLNGPVSAISVSKDGSIVYVGTEAGSLYRVNGLDTVLSYTNDNGSLTFSPDSFNITTTLINNFGNRVITGIDVSQSNPDVVLVTLGRYGQSSYVFKSTNANTASPTFTNIDGSGLPKMPVYCCIMDKLDEDKIMIGTELGVYSTSNGGASWTIEDNGLPRVPVLKFYRHFLGDQDNVILASSYGRGIFRTKSLQFTSVPEQNGFISTNNKLTIYPNPVQAECKVSFILPQSGDVQAVIYSMDGKEVKSVQYKNLTPGNRLENIDCRDLNNGTYIIKISGKGLNLASKMVVLQ